MEQNPEQIIRRMLGEQDLDGEAVLAKLVELLVSCVFCGARALARGSREG